MPNRPARRAAIALTAIAALLTTTGTQAYADSVRDRQWHLQYLHAGDLSPSQGAGVTVAVLDSGVDATHPDLAGSILPGIDLTGPGGDGRTDIAGHGTAMAADIAAHGHGPGNTSGVLGLAPQVKILPVRTNVQKQDDANYTPEGIHWAVDHGAKILNISQGMLDQTKIREATQYALAKGAIIIASTGNDGTFTIGAPAMYPGVIAVGGIDRTGQLWKQSTRGPETVLTAPAVDITTAVPGGKYGIADGTSDATALVTATIALIWSKYPHLDANNVINRLITTADHQGDPGRNNQYGYGIVNPLKALATDIPSVAHNPLTQQPSTSTQASATAHSSATAATRATTTLPAMIWMIAGVVGAGLVVTATLILVGRSRRKRATPTVPHLE